MPRNQLDGCAARCGTRTGEAASGAARNPVGETPRATEGCVRRSLDLEKKHLMDVLSACETLATSSGPYFTRSSHDGRLYALKYLDHGAKHYLVDSGADVSCLSTHPLSRLFLCYAMIIAINCFLVQVIRCYIVLRGAPGSTSLT